MKEQGYSFSYLEEYKSESNFFLGPITGEHIDTLVNNGFKVWEGLQNKAFLYVIDLNDQYNRSHINYINVTSTPQQIEYDNEHWAKFSSQYDNVSDEVFRRKKTNYFEQRDKHLRKSGIYKCKTVKMFTEIPFITDWSDMDKYVNINLTCGQKKQYASCIPHIQVSVSNPLKIKSVIDINSGKVIR